MRKSVLVLASLALVALLVSTAAWAAEVIRCEPGSTYSNSCHGTKSPDILRGTFGRDIISGFPSPRWAFSLPRDHDTIYGYAGNDTLYGGHGRDKLYGGNDVDVLRGGLAVDRLYGGTGSDTIDEGHGENTMIGGDGHDTISGSGWVNGGNDNDNIFVDVGQAYGGAGNDRVSGGMSPNRLAGDAGRDRVQGGEGPDLLYGGDDNDYIGGNDLHDWIPDEARDEVYCGSGFDTVVGVEPLDVIAADCEEKIPSS